MHYAYPYELLPQPEGGFTVLFPEVVLWLPKTLFPESVGCFRSPSGSGYICP